MEAPREAKTCEFVRNDNGVYALDIMHGARYHPTTATANKYHKFYLTNWFDGCHPHSLSPCEFGAV